MAILRRPAAKASETPPLTSERVAAWLRSEEYAFAVDDDGDQTAKWDGHDVWFYRHGEKKEVLNVRGTHKRLFAAPSKDEILLVVNEWHRDRPWPKAFVTVDDVGDLRVHATHSYDLEHGVTEPQLAQFLDCSLSTILQFFQHLDTAITSN